MDNKKQVKRSPKKASGKHSYLARQAMITMQKKKTEQNLKEKQRKKKVEQLKAKAAKHGSHIFKPGVSLSRENVATVLQDRHQQSQKIQARVGLSKQNRTRHQPGGHKRRKKTRRKRKRRRRRRKTRRKRRRRTRRKR